MPSSRENYLQALVAHTAAYENLRTLRASLAALTAQNAVLSQQSASLQLVGMTVADILTILSDDRYVVRSSTGPRYVVGISKDAFEHLKTLPEQHKYARVALDTTTLTIMRILPREVNSLVFKMVAPSLERTSFQDIGGLSDEILQVTEVIKRSIDDPQCFERVGVAIPKGVLLYGPPGTGKTLLARTMAAHIGCRFLKIVSSAIIEKYIGESAKLVREMFAYARQNAPCVIFFDEIDAIGGRRVSDSCSSDREVQRTLMELLAQLDGFDKLCGVKVIMATNRPDILDDALLRPGRIDRKVEIPLPSDSGRKAILRIHARELDKKGVLTDGVLDMLGKLTARFNGADLRNLCTEAGLSAIRSDREYATVEDFVKAARKIASIKKLESTMDYKKV